MTKCPYVPPHQFNLDFPHLMLRARAIEARKGKIALAERELTKTDRNGKIASKMAPIANWASDTGNKLTRPILEGIGGVHRAGEAAEIPRQDLRRARAPGESRPRRRRRPAHGRKAALYAT